MKNLFDTIAGRKGRHDGDKGVALLFVVLLTSVLALVAIGISTISYKEAAFSVQAKDSSRAFFAADTGVECGLYLDSEMLFGGGGTAAAECAGSALVLADLTGDGNYVFALPLGSECAQVSVNKNYTASDGSGPYTQISAVGYNLPADPSALPSACVSSTAAPNSNVVTRALRTQYLNTLTGTSPTGGTGTMATSGGTGTVTPPGPTIITTCEELQAMNADLSGSYELGNDIDCSATSGWNSGAGFVPIGSGGDTFGGTFNGDGHTITGLYINTPDVSGVGLFGFEAGSISNVGLVDVNITGGQDTGGLVGGTDNGASISDSYVTGTVSGGFSVGGLIGGNSNSSISDSYSMATVNGSYAGGLVGQNFGPISDSYSAGAVSGSNVGGFMGWNAGGSASDSFWDVNTSGLSSSEGCSSGDCTGATGESTSAMKTESTFTGAGWNFSGTWNIDGSTNSGYPFL